MDTDSKAQGETDKSYIAVSSVVVEWHPGFVAAAVATVSLYGKILSYVQINFAF